MGGSTTAKKRQVLDAGSKLAQHRLSVLERTEESGKLAEACRRRSMDGSSFYEWRRRFQTQGFEGRKGPGLRYKRHPQTSPPETV